MLIWSVWLSWSQDVELGTMIVGLKYDVWPLVILMSSVWLGRVYKSLRTNPPLSPFHKGDGIANECSSLWKEGLGEDLPNFKNDTIRWFVYISIFIVLWWLLRQLGKIVLPELFYWIWYGSVGDYVLWAHPPLYYRTWPGGMMRLQGLFAGPNNYGFFLVAYFSVVCYTCFSKLTSVKYTGVMSSWKDEKKWNWK